MSDNDKVKKVTKKIKRSYLKKENSIIEIRKSFHDNGVLLSQEHYKDGKLQDHGNEPAIQRWNDNGVLWNQAHYKDGKLQDHGNEPARKLWHDNGVLWSQEHYKDGKLHDNGNEPARKEWHRNGVLLSQEHYKDGVKYKPKPYDIIDSTTESCSICYELNVNCKTHKCNHHFHVSCLTAWLEIQFNCPFCRNDWKLDVK